MTSKFWDAESDMLVAEGPEILFEEGDWFLYDFNEEEDDYETSSMWHRCPKDRDNLTGSSAAPWERAGGNAGKSMWPVRYMDWQVGTNFTVEYLPHGWQCVYCYKGPPEKILTLFLLHNFDRIAKVT
jgi:hypothetical protein